MRWGKTEVCADGVGSVTSSGKGLASVNPHELEETQGMPRREASDTTKPNASGHREGARSNLVTRNTWSMLGFAGKIVTFCIMPRSACSSFLEGGGGVPS